MAASPLSLWCAHEHRREPVLVHLLESWFPTFKSLPLTILCFWRVGSKCFLYAGQTCPVMVLLLAPFPKMGTNNQFKTTKAALHLLFVRGERKLWAAGDRVETRTRILYRISPSPLATRLWSNCQARICRQLSMFSSSRVGRRGQCVNNLAAWSMPARRRSSPVPSVNLLLAER